MNGRFPRCDDRGQRADNQVMRVIDFIGPSRPNSSCAMVAMRTPEILAKSRYRVGLE